MTEDPFYVPLYAWEARGDLAPSDHTDWECVETFDPQHRAAPSLVFTAAPDHLPIHRAAS